MFAANAGAGLVDKLYVDDLFSTYTYTGNGGTQSIVNRINLSLYGGMVWGKNRAGVFSHHIYDTSRGVRTAIATDSSAAQTVSPVGNYDLYSFNTDGFSLGVNYNANINSSSASHVAWTFRKCARFFDIVTWTGDGNSSRVIPHNLQATPGRVDVKCTSNAMDWYTWHRSLTSGGRLKLNSTDSEDPTNAALYFGNGSSAVDPTSSNLYFGSVLNTSGYTYVAYIYGHDSTTDGIIQNGTFTSDASGYATINLGWEIQYILIKCKSAGGNWEVLDIYRGFDLGSDNVLYPNLQNTENSSTRGNPTSTGFYIQTGVSSGSFVYTAIRRSNKPPTVGTQVFTPKLHTGTGTNATVVSGIGFSPDLIISKCRTNSYDAAIYDRLRYAIFLKFQPQSEYYPSNALQYITSDGYVLDNDGSYAQVNYYQNYIHNCFKRAAGFLDVVTYTGTGANQTITHNLGAVPGWIMVKKRDGTTYWYIYTGNAGKFLYGSDNQEQTDSTVWQNTAPTATSFTVGSTSDVNANGAPFVAYLFGTVPGVSKVGTYTGNGTTNNIDCGFTSGARFVMLKSNDYNSGSWYFFDTSRGLNIHSLLNAAPAEVNSGYLSTYAPGFQITSSANSEVNGSGRQFTYLAIA